MSAANEGLRAESLAKAYRRRRVVDDVSLFVKPGEVVGLLGPNGAGKSTSFHIIVGLVRPDAGRVTLDGRALGSLPMHRRARAGLGYLPQDVSVFRRLSVRENLLAVLEFVAGLSRADRHARATSLIEEFDLANVAQTLGEQLSGGERRRVEIARCLATAPSIVLLDEPFAGIDPIAVGDLQRRIAGLAARGTGVLVTDHNVRETLAVCDRAYILVDGRVLAHGSREDLAANDAVRRSYLGDGFRL